MRNEEGAHQLAVLVGGAWWGESLGRRYAGGVKDLQGVTMNTAAAGQKGVERPEGLDLHWGLPKI